MANCIVQVIGMLLGSIAMILTVAVCAMPHWKVAIIVESNAYGKRIDGHWISRWDGLWMTCVKQSNNPLSCQYYSSSLSMTPDIKASRVLMSFAVLVAVFAFINALIGMLFDTCCRENNPRRDCLFLTAGISYILAGILVFIPVTWTASNIMREVCYSLCKTVQQQEIGEAILIGWPAVLLFFIGGSIFCWYNPCIDTHTNNIHAAGLAQNQPGCELCPEQNLLATERRIYRGSRKNGVGDD
ncbi:claudin-8-like [Ascaphus truei]|uniref:claudin-8-like n=1 Tax=Ascaphus truei TaxID=8439 RepID=UPI003F59CBC7